MAEKQPTIQNFIASMNKSGGYARPSKYAVVISPPVRLERFNQLGQTKVEGGDNAAIQAAAEFNNALIDSNANQMNELHKQIGQQVNLHCNSISMPGHDLQAQDVQHGSAPGRQMVTSHDYAGTIAATFYLDSHLRERHFFERWQQLAVSTNTHKANYYDDYIGSMDIYQLDANGEVTYGIRAIEVYPTTLAGIEYTYAGTNEVALQAVQFQYRQWYNLTSDAIAGYTNIRRNVQDTNLATVEKSYGPSDNRVVTGDFAALQLEINRQRRLRSPEVDRQLPNTSVQQEKDRQKQLRTPEIDRQGNSRRSGIKESKRQEQLRPPNSK